MFIKFLSEFVYNTVYKYLTSNKLLPPKNPGFKKGESTICQLTSTLTGLCHCALLQFYMIYLNKFEGC